MSQAAGDDGEVLWTRDIDWDAQRERRIKLAKFYGGPFGLALVLALVLGGFGAFLGVLIAGGLFGLLIVGWVEAKNHNLRSNRELRVTDGTIVAGGHTIPIADVERFTTYMTSIESTTATYVGPMSSAVSAGAAEFELTPVPGGSRRPKPPRILWLQMPDEDLASVKEALETVLPDRWQELEMFRKPPPAS